MNTRSGEDIPPKGRHFSATIQGAPSVSVQPTMPTATGRVKFHGFAAPAAIGLSVLIVALAAIPVSSQAQPAPASTTTGTEQLRYDIPAGPLQVVLSQFAGQAGVNLFADAALTDNLRSGGLHGSYSVAGGFTQLLQGTQLEANPTGNGRFTLRRLPGVSGKVTALEAVEVYGEESAKDAAYRAPQSVNVLSRDDIERFRGTSVGDIFQGIPGVLVGENRNSGGLDVNIRGMQGQGRVPVLVDGARQETTVYRGYAGIASRSYIDPDLLGGITIEKGPSMSAQGTGAVGGLVIARTLNADDIVQDGATFGIRMRGSLIGNNSGSPVAPGTTSGYYVRSNDVYHTDCVKGGEVYCQGAYDPASMVGPSGDTTLDRPNTLTPKSWAGSLALGLKLDKVDLVAAYATRRQGNYYAGTHGPAPTVDTSVRSPGQFGLWTNIHAVMDGASRFRAGELVVNSNYESKSSLLKADIHLTSEQELTLSWLRYHSTYGELMPSQLIWMGYIAQTDNSEVTANTYTAQYRWQPVDNTWLDVRANLWHTNTDSINRNYGEAIPGTAIWTSGSGAERYKRTGGDVSNTMLFEGWGTTEIRYGMAFQKEDVGPKDANNAAYGTERDAERSEYSAFIAAKYQPIDSVTLDAGWRFSHYSALDHRPSSYCETYPNPSGGQVTECETMDIGKVSHSGTAPIASIAWEFMPGWQAYARYAEALRMPSLFESSGGSSVGTVIGSYLRPEHARNRELGLSLMRDGLFSSNDALRLKFSYFRNDTTDYLTRTVGNSYDGGNNGWRMRNIQSARFHGFEVNGSYDAGIFFADFGVTRYNRIEICHVGSYRRQACTDYGLAVSYINNMIPPKWHGSATLGTRLFDRRLTLGMRGTFMGSRTQVPEFDDQGVSSIFATPVEWHAYRVFDLFASYRVNDNLSLDFNIDNITDRYYLDALGLGPVPAPGRTARLGVTLQF